MKFTDGYWLVREGMESLHPADVRDLEEADGSLVAYASTKVVRHRGDTLNLPALTVRVSSPAPGVARVRVEHHAGGLEPGPRFEMAGTAHVPEVVIDADRGVLRTGDLEVSVRRGSPWLMEFRSDGRLLTHSGAKAIGAVSDDQGNHWVHERLGLSVGEHVYGLGERFGPLVKNGQTVEIWNADGGTSSEQAYKNVPFYLSDRGYGVLVDHAGPVSFEVGSETVSSVQFSVPGQVIEYLVIDGPTPADVLRRYAALTGRPAAVPAWSFGLWLSTSFTTDYDEPTVMSFIEGMAQRDIPLSVFHFDCFWMREFHWTDLQWDPSVFPDPEGMLARLHDRGLRVSVWINPYIAQRSALFTEGKEKGYLVRRADGSVWQWDSWQAGMALVDFTNPDASAWFTEKLRGVLRQGVDTFKTDFGERIPTDVVWHDGSDPERMHNYYSFLYNQAVHELLVDERGEGDAVLFARSATVGGQQFPVHWGGDCDSTFESMAESLRGGLSLALSGFGYWSHDIGGFEGTPDPELFKRWLAFGLLSSHSRLHGSTSYRVPWAFDEEAVEVARRFTTLKMTLMPYLARVAQEATDGVPMMRPMLLEFPTDRTAATVETQYLLGDSLLVAPVFSADGDVDVYVPEGTWTSLLDGSRVVGPRWVRQRHPADSLPLLVRPGAVVPIGAVDDRPEYDWPDGVLLHVAEPADGSRTVVRVPRGPGMPGEDVTFVVTRSGSTIRASSDSPMRWSLRVLLDGRTLNAESRGGLAEVRVEEQAARS
ncbi:alpha-xylosidase [Actinotalea sp. M2MS4P-6]|uniref:alpha-xylosidase n=1 Tax=Actinotalea sp. M2MS4P-6 TaxID=2983762 RepID=UPI0021E4B5A5|nr:alpha-xylosidase [Actinotalea sp. M2MS4P-6]MCV2395310.1 alpha-xylosidase [Actinotalea sp. M2MS4P-6]